MEEQVDTIRQKLPEFIFRTSDEAGDDICSKIDWLEQRGFSRISADNLGFEPRGTESGSVFMDRALWRGWRIVVSLFSYTELNYTFVHQLFYTKKGRYSVSSAFLNWWYYRQFFEAFQHDKELNLKYSVESYNNS